jgi:hypothetical protein
VFSVPYCLGADQQMDTNLIVVCALVGSVDAA